MTTRVVSFTVLGSAKPKGSHDPMRNPHTNEIYLRPASAGLKAWEHQVRTEAARAIALNGIFFTEAVRVEIAFTFRRPVSVSVKKRPDMIVAPDIDKTCRSCLDAMTGILWRDDAQVTQLVASKAYGAADQPSRVEITVTDAVSASVEPLLRACEGATDASTKKAVAG